MARLNGGKAQTNMSHQFFPGLGNKNILRRDFSVLEKMFSLLFDSKGCSVYCVFFNQHYCHQRRRYSHFLKDVYSYAYYGHFIFPLRLLKMDMNVTP